MSKRPKAEPRRPSGPGVGGDGSSWPLEGWEELVAALTEVLADGTLAADAGQEHARALQNLLDEHPDVARSLYRAGLRTAMSLIRETLRPAATAPPGPAAPAPPRPPPRVGPDDRRPGRAGPMPSTPRPTLPPGCCPPERRLRRMKRLILAGNLLQLTLLILVGATAGVVGVALVLQGLGVRSPPETWLSGIVLVVGVLVTESLVDGLDLRISNEMAMLDEQLRARRSRGSD